MRLLTAILTSMVIFAGTVLGLHASYSAFSDPAVLPAEKPLFYFLGVIVILVGQFLISLVRDVFHEHRQEGQRARKRAA